MTPPSNSEIPQPPALVLTAQENGTESQNLFACDGTIHGYVTLPRAAVGDHTLESIWIGPKGVMIQHSRDKVTYAPPGRRTAHVWLRFTKEGRLWNPLSVQDPGDVDRAAYDGTWKVKVRWDEKTAAKTTFQVRCR